MKIVVKKCGMLSALLGFARNGKEQMLADTTMEESVDEGSIFGIFWGRNDRPRVRGRVLCLGTRGNASHICR